MNQKEIAEAQALCDSVRNGTGPLSPVEAVFPVGESPAPATPKELGTCWLLADGHGGKHERKDSCSQWMAERVAAPPEPTLTHGMNCSALGNWDAECTCGLEWRIRLQTEREMHNAWRKRGEEAEAKLSTLEQALRTMLDSARPNEKEHPTMFKAWAIGEAALRGESRQ